MFHPKFGLVAVMICATGAFFIRMSHGAPATSDIQATHALNLWIPPRLQWNTNFGYCGETSFISAGLFYGQYCSQYEARRLAAPGIAQSRISSQLLIGVNDLRAASSMKLTTRAWRPGQLKTTADFLVWVKTNVIAGHPVIIGVFNNEYHLYGDTHPLAGDSAYDHIVPVFAVGSNYPLREPWLYFIPSDVLHFSDNGLWGSPGNYPYRFSYRFGAFRKDRRAANAPDGTIYSLKEGGDNYGVAITGVADIDHVTIPVKLHTGTNTEIPGIRDGSYQPPSPGLLQITATVHIPDPQVAYNLYFYDRFSDVPTSGFNANAVKAKRFWRIPPNSGTKFTTSLKIYSNQVAVFRAVPVSAK